ncbi:M23 family metallopeptidase [Solwaraspora sp. WMMD1047]|uniref:M23 family metallopeptidase n=1 Tax=Solwaraspora sp. WMMD1047 TaxID=3016102 RepID=UPI00241662A5|nr:M23 family metallopeptidase [Solwaraspora sp. WMMD1047]MDG4828556.1 M23 family metallopeptidase [Solwaraspora sp. WMMD1047]
MRQRLSSEPDRYRGRRRVPTPPRSRYAAVVTTAFVGAGVVALGAGGLPDAKSVSPSALSELENAAATSEDFAARAADAERATRDERTQLESSLSEAPDAWVLPLKGYNFTSPYGMRWNKLHAGIDLAAPEGTAYRAIHSGTVTKAGWFGGYGYCVIIQHPDGTESVYGHSSNLLVQEGQQVKAGDEIGWVGNTGHSYGPHLHLEVHVNGEPTDPIPWLRTKGVDIQLQVETIYGGVVDS